VRALGYVTAREGESIDGESAEEQARAIDALCDGRGWRLLELVRDVVGENGKGRERPGLSYALDRIARGDASCLIVTELDRVSRSLPELGGILEWIGRSDGRFIAIDAGVDTAAPDGRRVAEVLIAVSGWERERLAERTRKGLQAARASGKPISRAAVGDVPGLRERIAAMRASGLTLQAIADRLNEEGVPTLRGGERWRPSSVQAAAGYRRPRRKPGTRGPDGGGRP
jgi:DNA invertase Pin-like site-specific DNA recombinase